MANADKPRGFKVGYTKHGGPAALNRYYASGTGAIYIGDPLSESTVTGHVKNIAASSADIPIGVAASYSSGTATTDEVLVYDDLQNTVFIGQDSGSAILGSSMTMALYDLTITVSTASYRRLSSYEFNSAGTTHQIVKVIDKVNRPDNAWGTNVDCYCEFVVDKFAHDEANAGS